MSFQHPQYLLLITLIQKIIVTRSKYIVLLMIMKKKEKMHVPY